MAILWTSLESTLGIICACAIVIRPLISKFFPDRFKSSKRTSKISFGPSVSASSRLSRTAGRLASKKPPQTVSGKDMEPQVLSGPGTFRLLEEDPYPFSIIKASSTTIVEVRNPTRGGGGGLDLESQSPRRSCAPGTIMVKKEWEVDSSHHV